MTQPTPLAVRPPMTRPDHLRVFHDEVMKLMKATVEIPLRPQDPLSLDRLSLNLRTLSAACETLAERVDAVSELLLDASSG